MPNKNPRPNEDPAAPRPEPKHGGLFVEKMFSGFGHGTEIRSEPPPPAAEEPFRALRQSMGPTGATYGLPVREPVLQVTARSPATDVMTDLTRVDAVTVPPNATVEEANKAMIRHRVRSLFVVSDASAIVGIITSTDIVGEKPIQVAQDRGVRHAEVLVHQVMTPAMLLEAIELADVQQARVGDIVETLKRSARQHALVVDSGSAGPVAGARTVRGMFSLTQIARQLGLPPQVGHDVARTFAEIEAAIGR